MKKIITFLSFLVLAATTQANTVAWGCTAWNNLNETEGSEGWASAGTMYWLTFFGATAPEGEITSFDPTTGLTNLGGTVSDSHLYTEGEWINGGWAQGYDNLDCDYLNGFWLVTMYDPATPNYFAYTEIMEMSGLTPLTPAKSLEFEGLGQNMVLIPIPEPSTLALLAFGVAAIGLRRKVTK